MKRNETNYVPLVLTELSMLKEETPPVILEGSEKETGFIGVNNFRRTGKVFGLSQPTTEGICNIVNFYKKKVIWINLREEPVIYINGLPFVLRDMNDPFSNIKSFAGSTYKRMEEMEERLKKDIEKLAEISEGFIKVYTEKTPKSLLVNNMYVRMVETTRDIFKRIGEIKYYRLPIGRIHSREPLISILDEILDGVERTLGNSYKDYLIGFNSSNGLEKTSYGMSVCLLRKIIREKVTVEEEKKVFAFTKVVKVLESVHKKESVSEFLIKSGNVVPILEKAINGKYLIIDRMIHAMDLPDIKPVVNTVIDTVEYNLLSLLLENILMFQCQENPKALRKSTVLMERYISLILYALYLKEGIKEKYSFTKWIEKSSIIQGVIHEITAKVPHKNLFIPALIDQKSTLDEERAAVIGAATVLQTDREMNGFFEHEKSKYKHEKSAALQIHQPSSKTDLSFIRQPMLWLNLRAEPVVYIEGVPHSERDRINPNCNIKTLPGITEELVNNQEEIVIRKIRSEGGQAHGEILFFTADSHKTKQKLANVKEKKLQTCKDFITEINPEMLRYVRVPMISKAPLDPNVIDTLYRIISEHRNTPIILQASGYMGRNRIVKILSDVVNKAEEIQNSKVEIARTGRSVFIRPIETLIRILSSGITAEVIVRDSWLKGEKKDIYTVESTSKNSSENLVNYMLLILLASYILEGETIPFRKWLNTRKDALHIYESIANGKTTDELDALFVIKPEESQKNSQENRTTMINRPWGQVVTPHTILKNDFFPALRILTTDTIDIKGCSNFRTIEYNKDVTVGLAQPTAWGVQSLIEYFTKSHLNNSQNQKTDERYPLNVLVHWFCLRQEPVVYVGGFPFVLRTTDMVYENMITEGIDRKWVEDIEERMKADCLEESSKEGLILHNEEINNGQAELSYEITSTDDILTPKEVFINQRLKYYRMPISDEQTPLPEIFDELYRIILSIQKPRILVFSCQMGRGRTTTGMIIARVVAFTEYLEGLSTEKRKEVLHEKRMNIVYKDQYRIISKLTQALPMGRESKNLVDSIIKECDHIQNIYEAISSRKNDNGYLMRYFYLICFGSFLLEKEEETFSQYLSNRIEIDVIAKEEDC